MSEEKIGVVYHGGHTVVSIPEVGEFRQGEPVKLEGKLAVTLVAGKPSEFAFQDAAPEGCTCTACAVAAAHAAAKEERKNNGEDVEPVETVDEADEVHEG